MSDLAPAYDGQAGEWEDGIELQLKTQNLKINIALGAGVVGTVLGALSMATIKKIAVVLGQIQQVLQPQLPVPQPAQQVQDDIYVRPVTIVDPAPMADPYVAKSPNDIGKTSRRNTETVDESRIMPSGPVAKPFEGPGSSVSDDVREAMAYDPLNPGRMMRGETI